LEANEFLRRFLLHVLPASFVRIRYFGLLANRHRAQLLALCRSHLQTNPPPPITGAMGHLCQHCHHGMMRVVEILSPAQVSTWLLPLNRRTLHDAPSLFRSMQIPLPFTPRYRFQRSQKCAQNSPTLSIHVRISSYTGFPTVFPTIIGGRSLRPRPRRSSLSEPSLHIPGLQFLIQNT